MGLKRGNGVADVLEQGHHGLGAKLGTAIGEGAVGGEGQGGVEPDEAQATDELAPDAGDGDGGIQVEGNDEPEGEGQRQFALSFGGNTMLSEGMLDRALGNGLGECVDGQRLAELAFGVNRSYCESHEVAPVWFLSELALESIPRKSPHPLFERYWA